jgi:hypothetical protein
MEIGKMPVEPLRKKLRVIACSIMKDELLRLEGEGVSFVFLEQSLHRTPQKMPAAVQKEIDKTAESGADYVVLGYGLCSNGILGVRPVRQPLVIPRAHDCISLFLGSPERYREEHGKEPGTYYLTKGWIDEGKSPLGILAEYTQRYGKETAEWAIREELKNYKRIALVDAGNGFSPEHRAHARENARFLNLKYEEIEGSREYFARMLQGGWEKDFLILHPGEEVKQEYFLALETA